MMAAAHQREAKKKIEHIRNARKIQIVSAWVNASRPKLTPIRISHWVVGSPAYFACTARTRKYSMTLNRKSRSICGNPVSEYCQIASDNNTRAEQ